MAAREAPNTSSRAKRSDPIASDQEIASATPCSPGSRQAFAPRPRNDSVQRLLRGGAWVGTAVIAASLVAPGAAAQQRRLHGLWIGGHLSPEGYVWVRMRVGLDSTANDRHASIDVPFQFRNNQRSDIVLTGNRVTFQFGQRAGRTTVDAVLRADTLDGVVKVGKDTRKLRLTLVQPVSRDTAARLAGLYETEARQLISIGGPTEWGSISYLNFATGDNRHFFMTRKGLVAGPTLFVPHPPMMRLDVAPDSLGRRRIVVRDRKGTITARKLAFREEDVQFTSDVTISGTLIKPLAGRGPHRVVVFVHGSGPTSRDAFFSLPYYFAMHGVASLVYDKRGVGRSGGTYTHDVDSTRFELLAADAIAGIKLLSKRSDIDTTRIGMWGISQAGWIIPIVAARAPEVDFVMIVSGPVTTLDQEGYFSLLTGDDGDGPRLPRAEIARRMKAYSPKGFDPVPFLRAMRISGLWIFGAKDESIPVDMSIEALEGLRKDGYPFEIVTFPAGQHVIWETVDGSRQQLPLVHRFVPGYFETLLRWMLSW